jgi:drug efflux transport system permease protein
MKSAFANFVVKEFYHILRDKKTLLVLFGMPIIQLILFGFAISTELNDANIGIIDKSKDPTTARLINKIQGSGYFKEIHYLNNIEEVKTAFKAGKIDEAVVFDNDFEKNLNKLKSADIQLITDASNPNTASLLSSYTHAIVSSFSAELNAERAVNATAPVMPEVKMLFNPELKSVVYFIPGLIALILMLVCALMTSIAITKEKEMGTMEILLVSPLRPPVIIIGKVIPYMLLSLVNAVTILLLAQLVFDIPFKGSYALFFGETFLFIMTALSLGIFISTVAKTQQVAMMVSLAGLLLPTVLLSGFIFPVENMPWLLQYIAQLIPAKWYLTIAKGIMIKGLGVESLLKETSILILMIVVLLGVSVKKFKYRLD